ncbi:disulfide oxidoreductase [Pseudooceanicola sediminis]|uniref:Disulfide oxidoreductase n=1 Tax=Pseudooceanicola sediminis TaxID=2211117 RepID=A0A399J0L6_9RHOB|nr:helicase-related protein [Pseudooceanicola sediminis]RII38079.1 disulfide oxidoreductase [Pseudooceanicola sediminis]
MSGQGRITAVLGPTNTGKTHYAIERMLGYRTGVIGLPLRLLAREVYDRIVAVRGPSVVALVTGEERIVPPRTQYWVCTVEAMPEGMGCDFLAIDEIQLCADPERGHVFTDRLLRARGLHETLFLGADTMRSAIADLVPTAQFVRRDRLSQLSYSGSRKISRIPSRSAIVGFSVDNIYAMAELVRRQKGGAAVVMGALSPRTRNAQVELYQNGDVDYLIATDAIGMGLNLDVNHVAFSSVTKFDGRRMRDLAPNELAQIAGRAGRGMSDGTFGVTGEAGPLHPEVVEAIMEHRFTPIRKLNWRNHDLRFGGIDPLIHSLEMSPADERLVRSRDADDLIALKTMAADGEVSARASDTASVRLLWDVCRIPDFRGISHNEHAGLLTQIFGFLHEKGRVPDEWLATQVHRIDRTEGDIDALSKRLAFIRTWTYVAQRNGWVSDESHWRDETRAVEDRLSDALHARLTQRFVDRRTSVLLRRLKQKEALLAEVSDTGEVTVEGEFVGRLEGFRFRQDKDASGQEAKTLRQASLQALVPHFNLRADRFYNAPDTEIDFTEQGGLMWGELAIGKLAAGSEPMKPQIVAFVDDEAGPDVAQKVERRLQHFIDRKIAALFEPLMNLQRDEALSGLARGFAFRLVESLGILPRGDVAEEVKSLDQDARGALRKHGVRFGQYTVFMPLLLKPAPTRLRLLLWALAGNLDEFPEAPPPGLVTVPAQKDMPQGYYAMAGYRAAGERAIRIDMLERLADMLRGEDSRGGFEAKADMLSISGMTLEQFADLMQGLGYKAEKGERAKVKAEPAAADKPVQADGDGGAAPETDATAAEEPPAAESDAPPAVDPTVDPAQTPSEDVEKAAATSTADPAAAEEGATAEATPEVEEFFTFTWAGRAARQNARGRDGDKRDGQKPRTQHNRGERPKGNTGKPRGKPGQGGKPQRDNKAKTFEATPPKKKDRIDPDNPFAAALMGLKTKD